MPDARPDKAEARKRGMRIARLHDDDLWLPGKLAAQMAAAGQGPLSRPILRFIRQTLRARRG